MPEPHTYSKAEIESLVRSDSRKHGLIPGMGNSFLALHKDGTRWRYFPVAGKNREYYRTRAAVFGERVEEAWWRAEPALAQKAKARAERRRKFAPPQKRVVFEFDLNRKKFGEIYLQLMNELNARKSKTRLRANPFERNLQAVRQQQADKIIHSKESLSEIHCNPPNLLMLA